MKKNNFQIKNAKKAKMQKKDKNEKKKTLQKKAWSVYSHPYFLLNLDSII